MVIYSTKKLITGIPRLKSTLLLLVGAVLLGGCAHQEFDTTQLSCAYVEGPKAHNCQNEPSQDPIIDQEDWNAKVTNSKPAQKLHAIGRPRKSTRQAKRTPQKAKSKPSQIAAFVTSTTQVPHRVEPKTPATTQRYAGAQTALAPAPTVQSYPDLPSIIRHTLRDNPDIGIAWAQERDERTSIDIARAALHPTVSVRAAFGPENFDTDSASNLAIARHEFGIDLHQTIYDFGRTQGNIARRKALYNSAGYRRIDKMNQIALEVSTAFLSTHEAHQHILIARQNVSSHEEILRLVTASQKAGNATVADVKRVTTRLEKARTNLIDLRSRKQSAREEFVRLTGLKPQNLSRPPKLGAPLPPQNVSSDKYPDSPALLSVRADIDSLRAQAKAAKANFQPTIDLDVSGNVKNNAAGETGMTAGLKGMVSFNYKFLDGGARLNTSRQIQIRITENKHRYRKKRRNYIQQLENAIRTVRANLEKSSLLATRVRDSKKVLSLYKAQFRDGSKTVFEMLDAQMDLFTTNSEKITNHYGKLRSIYEIYSLRGDFVGRILN